MTIGLYREIGGWAGQQDSAHIRDQGGNEMDVPRSTYEAKGYKPAFDKLPTKAEFEKSKR